VPVAIGFSNEEVAAMPRNPKPGAPLGEKELALAKALPGSSSIADAGRKAGMSRQAAHDAYEALKVKAPHRCEQLGIKRDRVLQRFDDWADNATHEVLGKFGERVKLEATGLRIKANAHLAKIFNVYKDHERAEGQGGPGGGATVGLALRLELDDEGRARAIQTTIATRRTHGRQPGVDAEVDPVVG
jgi:hypothetical protein